VKLPHRLLAVVVAAAALLLSTGQVAIGAPPAPSELTVESVTIPTKVVGGTTVQGTVTLSRPPDPCWPVEVLVSNDAGNPALVQFQPASLTIAAPATTGTFDVITGPTTGTVVINAFADLPDGSSSAQTQFFILPTDQTDIIEITQATLRRGVLTITATSDTPTAVLSAEFNNTLLGTLRNRNGRYSGRFTVTDLDGVVVVRSDLGGCASNGGQPSAAL
jgi:hypothetical protein